MKKSAWFFFLFITASLFYLSSIPGLRVLPVLKTLHSFLLRLDLTFVRFSEWIAGRIPLDVNEFFYVDKLTRDFLLYTRDNPIIIEFLLRKLAHVLIFFVLTIALFFVLHQYIRRSGFAVFLAFLGGGLFSFLDEYRQSFVVNRYASLVDVLINMIGVSLAVLLILFSLFITSRGRKQNPPKKNQEFIKKSRPPSPEQKENHPDG